MPKSRPLKTALRIAPYGGTVDSNRASSENTIADDLRLAGLERGGFLALSMFPEVGLAVATLDGSCLSLASERPVEVARLVEEHFRPRWVVWGSDAMSLLVDAGNQEQQPDS